MSTLDKILCFFGLHSLAYVMGSHGVWKCRRCGKRFYDDTWDDGVNY